MKQLDRFKYILPSLITAVLLFIICAIKAIYPFGNLTIDYYDLSNQIVTYYCHVYDVLHGSKSLFYDMYTALGTNMVGTCGSSNLSIFNLFFLFIKRESILPLMSVFLMIKMMAMAFTMFVFLEKVTKAPLVYKIAFSVGYAFSGFTLTTYTIIEWQDIVAFFPLIMLGLYMLIKEGKTSLYFIMLSMSLIAGYYISIMIIMFIFLFVGFLVISGIISKNDENLHLVKLFVSTVSSMMVSAFVVLPQLLQTLSSQRFGSESNLGLFEAYINILNNVSPAYTSRWFILANLSLPIAVIIYSIIKNKNTRVIKFVIFTCVVFGTEFLFESVNLMWHYGSYVHYPLRNGFMISFIVFTLAAICLQGKNEENRLETVVLFTVTAVVLALVTAILLGKYNSINSLTVRNIFHAFVAMFFVFTCLNLICLIVKNGSYKRLSIVLFVAELFISGYIFLGKPNYVTGYTEEPEMEDNYYYICEQIDQAFNLNCVDNGNDTYFERLKNPDTSLNSNYGLVLRKPVLSNWTALISTELQSNIAKLGYSVQYTRLLDAGGTVFSDALLGVLKVISFAEQDETLYKPLGTKKIITDRYTGKMQDITLYESRYNIPYGFVSDSYDFAFENGDICDIYNAIYKNICGDDKIAEYEYRTKDDKDGIITDDEGNKSVNKVLDISGKKALYYLSNQVDTDDYNTLITVNGNVIKVPSISEIDNEYYPAHFNNNALYLGAFSNESAEIEISYFTVDKNGNEIDREFDAKIISIDLDKMSEVSSMTKDLLVSRVQKKDGIQITLNGAENAEKYYVLPISYDKGYEAKVNGKKVDLIDVGGVFCAVKLLDSSDGNYEIELSFLPYGMKAGIVISIIGIIIIAMLVIFKDRLKVFDKEFRWLSLSYAVCFSLIILVMYVIPVIYGLLLKAHIL